MTDFPEEFSEALERLRHRFAEFPHLTRHAQRLDEQYRTTRAEIDRMELLLGRSLTKGEVLWVHRRLHSGIHVPGDADLDLDLETIDAAYRERLTRCTDGWRGPLDDIPPELMDFFPEP